MRLLELTLPTPARNLALDEALLQTADQAIAAQLAAADTVTSDNLDTEVLRIWEPTSPMLVLGRSSRYLVESKPALCRQRGVKVVRRGSGGAAVVSGPGCLMFSLVLSTHARPNLKDVEAAHQFSLNPLVRTINAAISESLSDETNANSASPAGAVARQGTSDLTLGPRKFSGNSLRVARYHLLYHGTLLYDMDLSLLQCLGTPPRQPSYRQGREHAAFVANLPLSREALRGAIVSAFEPTAELIDWPAAQTERLLESRFGQAEWTQKI